jgi:hypothetical protein
MQITKFAKQVAYHEGKKVALSIAQVMEVLKIVNYLAKGGLYQIVRQMK